MTDLYKVAKPGHIYVCGACGKTSKTRAGCDGMGNPMNVSPGWDESCMLNAVLCYNPPDANGKWTAVRSIAEVVP